MPADAPLARDPLDGSARYELRSSPADAPRGVLRGRDLELGRDLEIELGPGPEDPARAAFLARAIAVSALQHPGIAPLYEVGEIPGGRVFLARKPVEGETLAAWFEGGAPPDRSLLAVVDDLASTLAYAHTCGIAHGALEPQRVVVGPFGEVQLLGWHECSQEEATRARDLEALAAALAEAARQDDRQQTGETRPLLELAARRPPATAADVAAALHGHLASAEERAQAARVDAARERVRAAAERRARRLSIVLALVVLALGLGAGAGAGTLARGRVREDQRRREAIATELDEARRLLAQSDAARAVGAPDEAGVDLESRTTRGLDSAFAALERARSVAAGAPGPGLTRSFGPGFDALEGDLELARARLEREARVRARDARMLERIDALRLPAPDADPGAWRAARAEGYADAFREYGVDLERLHPAAASARLRASRIAPELALALDDHALALDDPERRARRLQIAEALDRDPFRSLLRRFFAGEADALERVRRALGRTLPEDLAPSTAALLGRALIDAGEAQLARDVLARAHGLHPTDFVCAVELALACLACSPPREEQATRASSAALALRPQSAWVRELARRTGVFE